MNSIPSIRKTVPDIRAAKGAREPLVCLTAYSAPMARLLDPHCDILLVGDSIGMALYGMENTLGVTLEIMIAHGKAVMRGSEQACVIIDMPFGTYEEGPQQAYVSALRVMQETGAHGVKLEGGAVMAPTIRYLTERNIPVMAHIGLQPQSVLKDGGYKVKGKKAEERDVLLADARAIDESGAFCVVIEGTVEDLAREITSIMRLPTIGIGASAACDGQILVSEDMLGLTQGHKPKFVKQYADLSCEIEKAVSEYAVDVRARKFPGPEHVYTAPRAVDALYPSVRKSAS